MDDNPSSNSSFFSVNTNQILKNDIPFPIRGVVYVPVYPGFLPWEIEGLSSEVLDANLKERIVVDLKNIKNLGANTVRLWGAPVYVYEALAEEGELNILQTIWFDGEVDDFQDDSYKEQCKSYIRITVDRVYSAYPGSSPPVIAFLVGNELSRDSIIQTDNLHPEIQSYSGIHIQTDASLTASEAFLAEMGDYLKSYENTQYGKVSLVSYSNEIRTYDILDTPFLDFRSHNVYSYAIPYYLSDPPTGSSTGTHYQGWIEYLKYQYPDIPLLITETGLSVSPMVEAIGPPDYGYGGNSEDEQAEGLVQNLMDIQRAARPGAGVIIHEYLDAWWKFSLEDSLTQDPYDIEEWFGLVSFVEYNGFYITSERAAFKSIQKYWQYPF
ncbi:MAG: hypothetical protein JEY91_14135 [Spirochaetaceae bacterium]|nr:hypothetical protein [Spirochaetaceae bacterium]